MAKSNFELMIVDNDAATRAAYKTHLTTPHPLMGVWSSVIECDDAESALKELKKLSKDGMAVVVADAYMPPYCDGMKPEDPDKLFGGFWLIDQVNKSEDLYKRAKVLLVTFYDNEPLVKAYLQGDKKQTFPYLRYNENIPSTEQEKGFYFLKKPIGRSQDAGLTEPQALTRWLDEGQLVEDTIKAISRILSDLEQITIEKAPSMSVDSDALVSIIGQSEAIKEVKEFINQVAITESTVLITGETGTGKELVARAIHKLSKRRNEAFVSVNSGAFVETLLESELFGHEKGAFTGATLVRRGMFERADGGTVFLDEVATMSPAMQVKLLRVLEEKTFLKVGGEAPIQADIRLICATNRDLRSLVSGGEFREDLYYRLNVLPTTIPPLRERKRDIPLLVQYFLTQESEILGRTNLTIDKAAVEFLCDQEWEGNVRHLKNVIERCVVLVKNNVITVEFAKQNCEPRSPQPPIIMFTGEPKLNDLERALFHRYLEMTKTASGYNKSTALQKMGLDPSTGRAGSRWAQWFAELSGQSDS